MANILMCRWTAAAAAGAAGIAALHFGPTVAAAAEPAYAGTWGIDAAQCKVPQDRQGAPMIVTAKGYDQHEAHCTFTSVKRSGQGWAVAAECSVESDKQKDAFTLSVVGDTLTIAHGKQKQKLKRCR
ncbi:MAG: hypothetical protein ACK4MF_07830 [Hyphomicrobiaceae bacterium]